MRRKRISQSLFRSASQNYPTLCGEDILRQSAEGYFEMRTPKLIFGPSVVQLRERL